MINVKEVSDDLDKDIITYRESDGMIVKIFKNKLNMIKYKEI